MRLTFYGGAGKVTGSNFLIEGKKGKVLVDCGLEQGADFSAESVYGPFSYDPSTIDALVVTHAHLDHIGRIPKLVKDGFAGSIFMTPATRDLAALILEDSVGILGEDAKRRSLPPLYTESDLAHALTLVEALDYHTEREVAPGLSAYLYNTGHILGSACVRIQDESGAALALTGDIGNSPSPLLPDFEPITDADALVMESVYGDRVHPAQKRRTELLGEVLAQAIAKKGAILIPAFSMERTQLMLYELSNFFAAGTLPKVPVYLDSPLAIKVTSVYEKWARLAEAPAKRGPTYFKSAARDEMKREGSLFNFPFLTKTMRREESVEIEKTPNPKIIIAGAGMSHGGRIGRWEAKYLPDPKTTLVIVGYQAPGSPGRHLAEGEKRVRLGGSWVENRATVEILDGWSAHADRDGLLDFAHAALEGKRTKVIFTALGEPAVSRFLAQRIHDYLGARAVAPTEGEIWEITRDSAERISQ
ncbi:MAG: MBL fold metallo-hydrolase [bacterium]|nr:MBL fold metallo-hydrolase [bacterium]